MAYTVERWAEIRNEWIAEGWEFKNGCDCERCQAEREYMASGGKPPSHVPSPPQQFQPDPDVWSDHVVTTKTKVYTFSGYDPVPEEPKETIEQRNERIWQAIRNAAGG